MLRVVCKFVSDLTVLHSSQTTVSGSESLMALCALATIDRGLGHILHDQLHWLDVPDRVLFKLAVTVH